MLQSERNNDALFNVLGTRSANKPSASPGFHSLHFTQRLTNTTDKSLLLAFCFTFEDIESSLHLSQGRMHSILHSFLIVAALLSSYAPIGKIGAGAFRKRELKCRDANAFGPVSNGRPCQQAGATCTASHPACTGIFDEDAQGCTDNYLACTCRKKSAANKTWTCPTAKCGTPDERCACPSPKLVKEYQVCYNASLNCPNGVVVTSPATISGTKTRSAAGTTRNRLRASAFRARFVAHTSIAVRARNVDKGPVA